MVSGAAGLCSVSIALLSATMMDRQAVMSASISSGGVGG